DGGVNWIQENSGDIFYDIEFQPNNPSFMYMASDSFFKGSYDGGHTWAYHRSPSPGATRCAVAVTPSDPDRVYFLSGRDNTSSGNGFLSLSISTDGGLNIWDVYSDSSNAPNILSGQTDGAGSDSQANYDLAMAVHPSGTGDVMVGGINVWKSD